jgi:N-acetylmuramate 1-kinase
MTTSDRSESRTQFLQAHGWGNANVEALPADMSFRRYFRLQEGARKALLMDSPTDKENIKPFVKIAQHLVNMKLSAPRIEALDEEAGFAVIEDFGNDTYTRLLEKGEDERPLYELAVDALATLHAHPNSANVQIPHYDYNKLLNEVVELTDWYYPALTGASLSTFARQQYVDAWNAVFAAMPKAHDTLVLRDYHVDNLMILEGREGVSRCGILDFQDAVIGHPAYDLVSLLEDARRDIDDELSTAMRTRYAQHLPHISGEGFDAWYAMLGAQRHAKVAGRFMRFLIRDNNDTKLCHIPRVMRLLERCLGAPILGPVKQWFDEFLPDPQQPLRDFNPEDIRKLIIN